MCVKVIHAQQIDYDATKIKLKKIKEINQKKIFKQ